MKVFTPEERAYYLALMERRNNESGYLERLADSKNSRRSSSTALLDETSSFLHKTWKSLTKAVSKYRVVRFLLDSPRSLAITFLASTLMPPFYEQCHEVNTPQK